MQNIDANSQSLLLLISTTLGPVYVNILLSSALLSFVFALALVIRGNGSMAVGSLLLIVPIPMLIGVFAGFHDLVMTYWCIAPDQVPDPLMLTKTITSAMIGPLAGMLLTLPAYMVAAIGTFVRSFASSTKGCD